jgi:hypothetical protein
VEGSWFPPLLLARLLVCFLVFLKPLCKVDGFFADDRLCPSISHPFVLQLYLSFVNLLNIFMNCLKDATPSPDVSPFLFLGV